MKYIVYILIICSFIFPKYSEMSKEQVVQKDFLFKKFKWLNKRLFTLYRSRSIEYKVPLKLALCTIQAESGGVNLIGRMNKNGTHDYGRMQINQVHMPKNTYRLLNDFINSKYGFWYMSLCLKKTYYYLPNSIRLYNQGLNGKRRYYKNWKYVGRILRCYN